MMENYVETPKQMRDRVSVFIETYYFLNEKDKDAFIWLLSSEKDLVEAMVFANAEIDRLNHKVELLQGPEEGAV